MCCKKLPLNYKDYSIIRIQYKFRVEILNISTGEVKETQEYKTKKNIIAKYSIPMYIVDKII